MIDNDEIRPDPDELLASLIRDEDRQKRGKLKIFFGMCAGVGKTFSMLQTARIDKLKGMDVVIGFIETHGRRETEELVNGFELIPRTIYQYRNTAVQEMDTDSILARKPGIVLVDELAHTNAPGSRHARRFQDVQELLENGISVYTTLNVQHLESRTETVAQITGIKVKETVPDDIFENSDEVELIDLTPDELLQRLAEGKVYSEERSREAIENFFRKGNITALREMALRIVADRVDRQLLDYLHDKRIRGPWKSGINLLVAINYRQESARLLRWAKNLSSSMGGQIQALYVETTHRLNEKEQSQLDRNFNLAKQLGIRIRIKTNSDIVKAVIEHARKENITHIIIGKPKTRNLFSMLTFGSFAERLIRYSGNIDVYIPGSDYQGREPSRGKLAMPAFTSTLSHYMMICFMVAVVSVASYLVKDYIGYQAVSFVLLILVSVLAIFFGTGPVLLAALLSALIWDFFFLPPRFTLHIEKPEDILMLIMYFIIALLSGVLTSRIRRQEQRIRIREERTNALYQLTRDLSKIPDIPGITALASDYIRKYFDLGCALLIKDEFSKLTNITPAGGGLKINDTDMSIASWVFRNSAKAGKYTDTLPSGEYTFYPLRGDSGNMGVVAVRQARTFTHGEDQFWEAFLAQISSKYEREYLREAARKTYFLKESDKLYKTLFNSISHELRIPVSAIIGAADTLTEQDYKQETRMKLYSEISTAALRLNRLIENLLNMSRLETGRISPKPDWCDVHDLSNSISEALREELSPFKFSVIIPPGMPVVKIDHGLIEQVIHNLILNSTQHAPAGSNIRLKFFHDNGTLSIEVMDRGPGFDTSELSDVFNKFFRGRTAKAGGTGLGLSIARGFIEAHNGTITAANRKNGGAVFTIRIPVSIPDEGTIKKEGTDEPV